MSEFDPLDTHAQEQAEVTRNRVARQKAEQEQADFVWLMGSKRGRRIVWRWLARAGVFRSSFDPDPALMAFREGEKNEGLRVLAQVHEFCPGLYPQMVEENADDRRNADDGKPD